MVIKDNIPGQPRHDAGAEPGEKHEKQPELAIQQKPSEPTKEVPSGLTDEMVDTLIEYLNNLKETPEMRFKRTLADGLLKKLRDDGYDDEKLTAGMAGHLQNPAAANSVPDLLKGAQTMIRAQSDSKPGPKKKVGGELTQSEPPKK